jgi:hypothetical protein
MSRHRSRIGDLNRAFRVGMWASASSRNPYSGSRMRLYFERGRAQGFSRRVRVMYRTMGHACQILSDAAHTMRKALASVLRGGSDTIAPNGHP